MESLLDIMFIKRFCLPSNIDIESYKNGKQDISQCICGNYNHIACILQGKDYFCKKTKILCYGVNKMPNSDNIIPGIHAEHDAIRKLLPLKRNKRLETINILVIRLSGKNQLQSSKPCFNCIEMMKTLPITLDIISMIRIAPLYKSFIKFTGPARRELNALAICLRLPII